MLGCVGLWNETKVLMFLFLVDLDFFTCCFLKLLFTAIINFQKLHMSQTSAFTCWICDDHWVDNYSILSNYFTDLYASSNQEIMKSSIYRCYSWTLLQTIYTIQNYSCAFPRLQKIELANNEQFSYTMSTIKARRVSCLAQYFSLLCNFHYYHCNSAWEASKFSLVIPGKRHCSIHFTTTVYFSSFLIASAAFSSVEWCKLVIVC